MAAAAIAPPQATGKAEPPCLAMGSWTVDCVGTEARRLRLAVVTEAPMNASEALEPRKATPPAARPAAAKLAGRCAMLLARGAEPKNPKNA
eukprot:TRINITY_DN9516_c0_g1_i1.p1 TRINITY_DN9516_c0_g1~~TRINITY_DN9516_c0_g1_i1.p1  ORF type:complete len:101 (+),score=22.06 TRINITY_DN9516_c0_g1_i1:32-304(+)